MSSIKLESNASGTGIFTIASPNSNTNRTLTLPDSSGTLALAGSSLTGVTDSASPFETALGTGAGGSNTGVNNTFVGYNAGTASTTGTNNTAVGYNTLAANTTGSQNNALGSGALDANTSGSENTALGHNALGANTSGNSNTGIGRNALLFSNGNNNTAVGSDTMTSNTTGANNTAVGNTALGANTTGTDNTAVGFQALDACTTGPKNTAVGRDALPGLTTADECIGIGYNAGTGKSTAGACVYIGGSAAASSSSVAGEIVLATPNQTGKGGNTGFINPGGGGVYQGNNSSSWSTTSDQRLKKNIVDNTEGLDKVSAIRVRNFEYRTEEEITDLPSHTVINKTGVQLGVIAQELQQVCPDCVKEETTGVLSVDSDNIFWHMVNAIKDLKAINDAQAIRIEALETKVAALEAK